MEELEVFSEEIEINGVISRVDGEQINEDEFRDLFIKWVEDNGFKFGGSVQAFKSE